MTQQIINVGTGPDSYTGDTLRTAFEKTNSNFDELYTLAAADQFGNLTANALTVTGNVTAARFIGDGSLITGIATTANLGNLSITGITNQTLAGTVTGTLALKPYAGSAFVVQTEYDSSGILANLLVQATAANTIQISTGTNANGVRPTLRMGANSASIIFDGTNNIIGFNGTPNPGFDYTFNNGSLYSQEFYAAANFPTGYQFTTPGGLTGMSHTFQNDVNGNVSVVNISHDNATPAKFYENNTSLLSGNLVVLQTGSPAGTFPNAFVQTYSKANTYTQFIWQNLDSNASATGDIVVTADTGTDTKYFIDMGMTGSGYDNTHPNNSLGTSINPLDGYIYVQGNTSTTAGGNLVIGTSTPNTEIRVLAGGVNAANVVAKFTGAGLMPGANVTQSLGSSTQRWKDLWLSNSTLYLGDTPITVSGGTLNVNGSPVSSGSNYGDANVAAYLPTYTGNIAANIVTDNNIIIDNREAGVIADISIYSADNILLQGADRTNAGEPEGGDINISGGNGGADNNISGATGGGDVVLRGGFGGFANTISGGFGGTVDIIGGTGGEGSATASAGAGGGISITAGDAGVDNGGGGSNGGGIYLTAGDATDAAHDRGSIVLSSGEGGDETSVGGYVQISIPTVGTNPGGQWTFTGLGTVFEPPPNAEIFSPSTGNLTVGTVGNTIIRNIGGVTTYEWVFSDTGNLTTPGSIQAQNIRTVEGTVHVGQGAGLTNQGTYAIAMGRFAGSQDQSGAALAIGQLAGQTSQGQSAIALGLYAANDTQSANAVAIGTFAGRYSQGQNTVAIGVLAGNNSQGGSAVAIGAGAGANTQGINSVAVGVSAADLTQGNASTALGAFAGQYNQGNFAVAVGSGAAYNGQGDGAIAIGADTSPINQGDYSIAIGAVVSTNAFQPANSIIIDATASQLAATGPGFFVAPIRSADGANVSLSYNTSTKEISYSANTFVSNTYVPSTAGSAGTVGQISFDGDYVYVCVGTSTWKRANLSTW